MLALALPLAVTAPAAETPGWRDVDLLNGRLVMSVPPHAEIESMGAENIMGAAPSGDSVTKLKIPADGAEIVVEVRELYALFPQEPERFFHDAVLEGEAPSDGPPPGWILLDPRLTAYGITGGSYRYPSGVNVLANLLVAQPDGTAQFVYIVTWDAPPEVVQKASQAAERMAASLRPGPRQSLGTGGRRLITSIPQANSATRELTVTWPEGHALSVEQGPDFTVHTIAKLLPLDAPGARLGIYIGHFPSYFYVQEGIGSDELGKIPASIVGHETVWLERQAPAEAGKPAWTRRETILSLEASSGGLKMHLFATAPTGSGDIDALTQIAEQNLRLTAP
jgi:hypothetical protein